MNSRSVDQNYYELLEVQADAPHHEIVKAYERAKLTYSTDSPAIYSMFSAEEAKEIRGLIEEAFKVLGNHSKRKDYDLRLSGRGKPASSSSSELPDFGPIPEPTPISTPRATPTSPARSDNLIPTTAPVTPTTVPSGFAKHRFGVYEINEEIENEIRNQTLYDGPFIRKVRQYKNINIEQLSKESRISRTFLAAIEGDDYDALPAQVFVRGFVVQVARLLGLDENKVATSYMEKVRAKGK